MKRCVCMHSWLMQRGRNPDRRFESCHTLLVNPHTRMMMNETVLILIRRNEEGNTQEVLVVKDSSTMTVDQLKEWDLIQRAQIVDFYQDAEE